MQELISRTISEKNFHLKKTIVSMKFFLPNLSVSQQRTGLSLMGTAGFQDLHSSVSNKATVRAVLATSSAEKQQGHLHCVFACPE